MWFGQEAILANHSVGPLEKVAQANNRPFQLWIDATEHIKETLDSARVCMQCHFTASACYESANQLSYLLLLLYSNIQLPGEVYLEVYLITNTSNGQINGKRYRD